MTTLSRLSRGASLRVAAILCLCILASIVPRRLDHIESDRTRTRTGSNTRTAKAGKNKQSRVQLPSPAERIKAEISDLEEELITLAEEYKEVTDKIDKLTNFARQNGRIPESKTTTDSHLKGRREATARPLDGVEAIERQKIRVGDQLKNVYEKAGDEEGETDGNYREPKKWWMKRDLFSASKPRAQSSNGNGHETSQGSIIPIDLSVNHLRRIVKAPASPNKDVRLSEEFLPVVLPHEVTFRWRSLARAGASADSIARSTAYRIVARRAYAASEGDGKLDESVLIWDSGKVLVENSLPNEVKCTDPKLTNSTGAIIQWRVTVDDSLGRPTTSDWTKFSIGPGSSQFTAKWISHPIDVDSWDKSDASAFWGNDKDNQEKACKNWERRSQLPLFRVKIPDIESSDGDGGVESAMLFVSGLGSFRASLDGVPLSSSGPIDPPLTDYAQRVSYRGFDVTPFLVTGDENDEGHVLGIQMGSGWWDHRPIAGSFIRLFYFPHGGVTCVAELHVTYKSGKTRVVMATGDESGWQVAKGHLRESSLFSGEYIDLKSKSEFEGWDTTSGYFEATQGATHSADVLLTGDHSWIKPKLYESDTDLPTWRYSLEMRANARRKNIKGPLLAKHKLSPIGKLIPHEIPPIMPLRRHVPDEVYGMGNGRWMYDFGVGFSGMVRFEEGLPNPIVPEVYPRGHTVSTLNPDEEFITVVYGESIEPLTGDINIAVVAGMGLHDGGPRHKAKPVGNAEAKGGPCYPKDHIEAGSLLQRDVYILPRSSSVVQSDSRRGSFADARQSHFTTHAFRFVEICCTAEPPSGVVGLSYRTAFDEWGAFGSSNVRVNGGYELVKNAMNSNLLSVQSDCPHREKIQYGGDIVADSPAALHFYDMSAFYRKVVRDWRDQQWSNGAYAGTSHWLALNDYAGIGTGSGETVWASAPIVTTARHYQWYGDKMLLEESFEDHLKWFTFLKEHFDTGLKAKGYDDELKGYRKEGSGLGDWLTTRGRDTWLTHQGFYMATARCLAFISKVLGDSKSSHREEALETANMVRERIVRLYTRNDGLGGFYPPEVNILSPGPEMSLFSRIVEGDKRCLILRNYFKREGHTWPGSDENRFLSQTSESVINDMIKSGEVTKRGSMWSMGWSQWHAFNEGIFAIRYALKTLSDNGFHNVALAKANGFGVGTFEYQMSHNATTHWESWWRSEDLYSHNHPMLGASAEWMASSVAGVSLHPLSSGGGRVLFWPRFPNSASTIQYAWADQGTARGDYSIAWRFLNLPDIDALLDSAKTRIQIRLYVPPDGQSVFRLPEYSDGQGVDTVIRFAITLPDIEKARFHSQEECQDRRDKKMGFNYNWEFDRTKELWEKVNRKKAIGTPCQSFLFHSTLDNIEWSGAETIEGVVDNGIEVDLGPGLYDVMVNDWQLKPEVRGTREWRIGSMEQYSDKNYDIGPYCADTDTFDWNIDDANYLI